MIAKGQWHRFIIGLDGTAIACELRVEASGQPSGIRLSDKQPASLFEKPRLAQALVGSVKDKLSLINLLLFECDMPWSVLVSCSHGPGLVCTIVDAAEQRRMEIAA